MVPLEEPSCPAAPAPPLRPLGLTKEVLSAHTQREEQAFLTRVHNLSQLRVFDPIPVGIWDEQSQRVLRGRCTIKLDLLFYYGVIWGGLYNDFLILLQVLSLHSPIIIIITPQLTTPPPPPRKGLGGVGAGVGSQKPSAQSKAKLHHRAQFQHRLIRSHLSSPHLPQACLAIPCRCFLLRPLLLSLPLHSLDTLLLHPS